MRNFPKNWIENFVKVISLFNLLNYLLSIKKIIKMVMSLFLASVKIFKDI